MVKRKREGTHYQLTKKDNKEHYSLRELNQKINKVPSESTYKKLLSDFRKACELQKVKPETFREGRDFRIPRSQEALWSVLLTTAGILKLKPKGEDISEFANKVIEKKNELEKRHLDDGTDSDSYLIDDMASLEEMLYAADAKADIFFLTYEQNLIDIIQRDFKYIMKNVPRDRWVFYAEFYLQQVERARKTVLNMIKDKPWEQ